MTPGDITSGDLQILAALLRCPSGVDLDFFQREFGVTATQVHGGVERLRASGCRVEPHGLTGLQLIATDLPVWRDYLEHRLREDKSPACTAAHEPWRVVVYRQVRSTQDIARQLAQNHVVVLADEQTAGRGRLGRKWLAPPGTCVLLTMTYALGPENRATHDHLQFVAAVAAAQALERMTGNHRLGIKWPNDLVAGERKLAGILIETITAPDGRRLALIGIGINVNLQQPQAAPLPEEVRQRATDLRELGGLADRLHVAAEVVAEMDKLLRSPPQQLLRDEWRARSVLHHHRATFQTDGRTCTGTVLDLDMTDGLIVRCDDGTLVHLHAATTSVLALDE